MTAHVANENDVRLEPVRLSSVRLKPDTTGTTGTCAAANESVVSGFRRTATIGSSTAAHAMLSATPMRRLPSRPNRGRKKTEEHTSELQSRVDLVCRLLLEKKKKKRVMPAAAEN